jgi:NADPH2:quinone reductase
MAVQLAQAFGATAYATVSKQDIETVTQYGAIPIDYETESVEAYVQRYTDSKGFDIVYDTVGGATLDASFTATRRYYGHVVSCLGWGAHSLAPLSFRGATYSGVFTLLPLLTGTGRQHHGEILGEAARLVDDGQLKVKVDPQAFDLIDADLAHQLVISGKTQGKVVIEVSKDEGN